MQSGKKDRVIEDPFGRRFPYLRLSVTDVCNFRCSYCLPEGHKKTQDNAFLSVDEIRRLVAAFAGLGAWKVRLTGGEPTLRPDFCDIAQAVSNVPGIRKLAFTTNGYKLPARAQSFYDAGLRAINVSIDSLDPGKFHEITGHDRLDEVVEGVEAALKVGFESVKVNVVLLKGINDEAVEGFLSFIENRPVSLRFIELMQTGENLAYFRKHHVSAQALRETLASRGWVVQLREEGAGPAIEYRHRDYQGTVGIIAPYARDFCASCNRLRVSARGDLHLCLFGERGYPLRHLLQRAEDGAALQDEILRLMAAKKETHFLHTGATGVRVNLSTVGG